jgi:single-stranded DNA-specific DHH superfamily exonuclease
MLTKKQVKEIQEHLLKAQNPLFYFDNDQDGLCSYLLLKRFYGKGNPVPVKNSPMGKEYFRRVLEFEPDYIFILDVPEVKEEFFNEIEKYNLPVVWIDHHKIDKKKIPKWVDSYNVVLNKKSSNEPVTRLCYQVTEDKKDLWLAVVGCISDKFLPDFYLDFLKMYPDLGIETKEAFGVFYSSEIGKIARMIGAGLKDRTTNVIKMIRFLSKVRTPYEVLEESKDNSLLHERFKEIDGKYQRLISKAKEDVSSKVLFFKYAGETSMSADLANGLSYEFPEKIVVVAYVKGSRVNLSLRGESILEKVVEILKGLENATGGGHENAVGCQINIGDLEIFKKKLEEVFD